MLYVFYGTDTHKSLEKARNLVNSLRTKRPDASYIEVGADDWRPSVVEENAGGQGLFSSKYIVFLNRIAEKAEVKEWLTSVCDVMHQSDNIFIVLEGKANAESKRAFEKHADKVVVTDEKEIIGKKKEEFNVFALGDAFGARDGLKAWRIYREALSQGLEIESILGTLFWQAKSIAVAGKTNTANEAGLSPFVYSKSKKYSVNFSRDSIDKILEKLIKMYHDGHRGLIDPELELERFLLGLSR